MIKQDDESESTGCPFITLWLWRNFHGKLYGPLGYESFQLVKTPRHLSDEYLRPTTARSSSSSRCNPAARQTRSTRSLACFRQKRPSADFLSRR